MTKSKNKINQIGLEVSIEELREIVKEMILEQAELCTQLKMPVKIDRTKRQLIFLINKMPKSKETWEIKR